jgi:hypothetical protein
METTSLNTTGRQPGAYTFEEARQLSSAVWTRDANRRNWVAVMRNMYRTGKFDLNVTFENLSKPIWDRNSDNKLGTNFARQYVDIIVGAVAGDMPDAGFDSADQSPESVAAADYAAALVMGFIEDDDVSQTLTAMAKDASVSGHGFGHVRWKRVTRPMTDLERKAAADEARQVFLEEMAAQGFPDVEVPADLDKALPTEVVVANRPTLEYVSPANVLLPADVSEVRHTPWYAIVKYLRLSELRGDDTYDQEAVEALAPKADVEERTVTRKPNQSSEETVDPVVKVYFFYDVASHRLIVFGDGGPKPLYEGANPAEFDDVCLVDLPAYRDGESFWGFGDLEGIAGLLEKVGLAVEQQVLNLGAQGPIFVAWGDVLSSEDEARLRFAKPYDFIKLSTASHDSAREAFGDGVQPGQLVSTLSTTTALPADVFNVKAQLKDDVAEIAGVSEFMRGGLGPSRMPGTAAAAAEGWASVRINARAKAVERAFASIANLFFKLCQEQLSEEDVVRLVGPSGESWSETVDVQRLSGDFFVRVRTGSHASSNPAARAQRGRELMGIANELEAAGYDVDGLRDAALRDLGVDPRQVKLVKRPPEPAADMGPAMGPEMAPGAPMGGQMTEGLMGDFMGGMGPQMSPQDQMAELGAPPLPGAEGGLLF